MPNEEVLKDFMNLIENQEEDIRTKKRILNFFGSNWYKVISLIIILGLIVLVFSAAKNCILNNPCKACENMYSGYGMKCIEFPEPLFRPILNTSNLPR